MQDLIHNIKTNWKDILIKLNKTNLDKLVLEDQKDKLLPKPQLIFRAFDFFNIQDLKVVIIGQDCYPTKSNAMGLCFSVPEGQKCAASLRNIFKELYAEYGIMRTQTDLSDWAAQGVLLLNTALTVKEGCAGSHLKEWRPFTWDLIRRINSKEEDVPTGVVYILWGAHAREYAEIIDGERNLILTGIHPSPLAARSGKFVGFNHFKKTNEYLNKIGKSEISWFP
jgi:uracil-DNA glycosylase